MFSLALNGKHRRLLIPLLTLLMVSVLSTCSLNVDIDSDRTLCGFSGNVFSENSSEDIVYGFDANSYAGLSILRNLVLKCTTAERIYKSRILIYYTFVSVLLALLSVSAFLSLHFCETIWYSRLFIIHYIHDLDGMKP